MSAFPSKTADLIKDNLDLDLFDFYMIPFNSLSYMMDISAFNPSQRKEFEQKLIDLDKKVIATRILAAGVLKPRDTFEFFKKIDYIDLISLGVASVDEAKEDFSLLKQY